MALYKSIISIIIIIIEFGDISRTA